MLLDLSMTPAELMARAVRDHLADCTHTLPMLIDDGRDASLHLFMANLGAMRRQLFPSLQSAYQAWMTSGDAGALTEQATRGSGHWRALAGEMLLLHERHGEGAARPIAAAVERAAL
jgi:hypothetical protein